MLDIDINIDVDIDTEREVVDIDIDMEREVFRTYIHAIYDIDVCYSCTHIHSI